MNKVANASINTFGTTAPKAGFVPPSEQVIVISIAQLQDLISQAVQKALQPLVDRVSALEEERDQDRQEIDDLRRCLASLEAAQDTLAENQLIQLRLINDLRESARKESKPPTANQENRAKILRALLAAHGGKMLTKEARRIMKMDKGAFSRLVASMPEYIETKKHSLNKRQTVLILKSRSIVDDNDQRLK